MFYTKDCLGLALEMWKTYSKYLLGSGFHFFKMVRLVAYGRRKSQVYSKADLVCPAAVSRGIKNFSFTLFFIICKKQQGEGLSSYKY